MSKKKSVIIKKNHQPNKQVIHSEERSSFVLAKENYILMAIGLAIIILGFILLSGGGSEDPNIFDPSIFNFRRTTLAPLVLLFGFLFEIYAIMKKPKDEK